MIEVKIQDIVNSVAPMRALSESKIKGATAYKVGKLLKRLEEEFGYFNDARMGLINQYAVKDEEGNPIVEDGNYQINKEFINEFNEETNKLLQTEVSIDVAPIFVDDLSEVEITPQDMLLIEPFLTE